jgi:feruloyl-CoA synthase
MVQDAVITGHDRDGIGALLFMHPQSQGVPHEVVQRQVSLALHRLNSHAEGSATRVTRALVLEGSPKLDHGEITDKGYINQRTVLILRAHAVEALYDNNNPAVIRPADTTQSASEAIST